MCPTSNDMARHRRKRFFDEAFLSRLERLHLIAKRLVREGSAGRRRSRRLGDGLEFADHRAYAPGDDLRFIDWPYYARMEKLLLRLFHEHSDAGVVIMLDCSASQAPGRATEKFDYARIAAAALAYVAMGSLDRVLLVPFAEKCGRTIRAGRDRARIFDVLDSLARIEPGGRTDLLQCIKELLARYERAATVLIISDLLDCADDLGDGLSWLALNDCRTVVLHLYEDGEARPQLAGSTLLQDAETQRQMRLQIDGNVLESYHRRWHLFQSRCRRACVQHGAIYVPATTSEPLERLILSTLRRAGVLAG